MNLYVLEHQIKYESGIIMGVFDSLTLAQAQVPEDAKGWPFFNYGEGYWEYQGIGDNYSISMVTLNKPTWE